jgi:hypothetical protein
VVQTKYELTTLLCFGILALIAGQDAQHSIVQGGQIIMRSAAANISLILLAELLVVVVDPEPILVGEV